MGLDTDIRGVSTLFDAIPPDEEHREGTVKAIGISLLTGFALMLLWVCLAMLGSSADARIESLTPHPPHEPPESPRSSPSTPHTPLDGSLSRSSNDSMRPLPVHMDSRTPIMSKRLHVRESHEDLERSSRPSQRVSTEGLNATLGLVIHGAADGIALGASSRSGSGSLGLIVFMAVLVHKGALNAALPKGALTSGPTALGLTTTLLSLGLTPQMIRRRLMIFSFAAPIGAILTYLVVGAFGANMAPNKGDVDGLGWWTGIALLFSVSPREDSSFGLLTEKGGSFLYVATVIQPLSSSDPHDHSHAAHSHTEPSHPPPGSQDELGKYARTILLCVGMVLPLGLSWIVGDHGH